MRAALLFFMMVPMLVACSTTYVLREDDLAQVRRGAQVANLRDDSAEVVDFSHYSFVYKEQDREIPLKVKGVESLNSMSRAGQLKGLQTLRAVPDAQDHAWQRTVLGGGVGLAAGLGIGYAVSNRIVSDRSAQPGCSTCTGGYIALGTIVSGVVGAAVGSLIAYFAVASVGSTRTGLFDFFEAASAPAP